MIKRLLVLLWIFCGGAVAAEDTVRLGLTGFPSSRGNPFNTTSGLPSLYTYAALFEGLTRVDNNAQVIPMLAVSWEAETPTSWVFRMRPDAEFSNGEAADAFAADFALDFLRTPEGQLYPIAVELLSVVESEAVDPTTLRLTTSVPNILLPNELAALKLVAPAHWQELGPNGYAADPIGTGPFKVTNWSSARIDMQRSPNAWRQAKAERIELYALADAASRVQGLLSGRLNVAVQLAPDDIPVVEAAGHKIQVAPDPGAVVVAFITERESPLQDLRVRQALNYAVNRQAIAEGLLGGMVRMATQPTPSIAFGYNPDLPLWPYDPDKARALLVEAGYPDGFKFRAEILNASVAYGIQVYQQVAVDLARIGVEMEMRLIPIAQYARGVYFGEWGGEAFGVDYGVNPSLDALRPMVRHSCQWPQPWYCDETIIPKLEGAASTFDLAQREALTKEIMRHQRDMAPGIFLYELTRFDGLSGDLSGFSVDVGHISYEALSIN